MVGHLEVDQKLRGGKLIRALGEWSATRTEPVANGAGRSKCVIRPELGETSQNQTFGQRRNSNRWFALPRQLGFPQPYFDRC